MPRLVLKPVFVGSIALISRLPLQLFLTFWATLFFGGITQSLLPNWGVSFVLFGLLAFFGVPAVTYIGRRLNYSRTEFRFFDDHVEFDEGFFTLNRKVVAYHNIREVTLRRGVLQRPYGLGSVYLGTLATGSSPAYGIFRAFGFGNVSGSGVLVPDIRDPDGAYNAIKALVDSDTNGKKI